MCVCVHTCSGIRAIRNLRYASTLHVMEVVTSVVLGILSPGTARSSQPKCPAAAVLIGSTTEASVCCRSRRMTQSLREQSRHCPPEVRTWNIQTLPRRFSVRRSGRWEAVPAGVQELLRSGPGQRWYGTGLQHQATRLHKSCSAEMFPYWGGGESDMNGQSCSARFSDKKKDLPGDIDSAIKALFELYDPAKKGHLPKLTDLHF